MNRLITFLIAILAFTAGWFAKRKLPAVIGLIVAVLMYVVGTAFLFKTVVPEYKVFAATAVDATGGATCASSCASTISWTHTFGSITDGVIVVNAVHSSGVTVSSVTVDGNNATRVGSSMTVGAVISGMFYYASGSMTGAKTVTVTLSGTPEITASQWGSSISFSGADQSSPVDVYGQTDNGTTTGNLATTTVTTLTTGDFLVDVVCMSDNFDITKHADQTQLTKAAAGLSQVCGSSYKTSATGAPGGYSMSWTSVFTSSNYDHTVVAIKTSQATLEQEGYRFRNDDGSESTATWLAAQDTTASTTIDTATRLRMLINATGTPASTQYQLEYREVGDTVWGVATTSAGTITETITTLGTSTWAVPFGVTSVQASCWGAGGGGDVISFSGGGGGGGGAFASSTVAVVPGQSYSVFIGTGGTSATSPTAGGHSSFSSSTAVLVLARGGSEAVNTAGGAGGATTTSIGTLKYKGGNAGNGSTTGDVGGGGGGSAGPDGPGGNGANGNATSGAGGGGGGGNNGTTATSTIGGIGGSNGGQGGLGDSNGASDPPGGNGSDGTNGGGGAGGGDDGDPGGTGGAPGGGAGGGEIAGSGGGGNGQCKLIYTPTHKIFLSASANIAAAAASSTTAQLTAPTGKTTASSTPGRISDDTNPLPAISIGLNNYTELEWAIIATSPGAVGDFYEFRVTAAGTALNTYSKTPILEIIAAGEPPAPSDSKEESYWFN